MRLQHSRRNVHDEDHHGIDLAPMLDFCLNLLIFFIMTAVFIKEYGLMVNRPSGAEASKGGSPTIAIYVLASGQILIDDRIVDPRAVRANVERLHANKPSSGVLIIADRKALTDWVVSTVDQVHEGGITNITFGTSG
jgi:biopolymer transport protein ExbD